MPTLAPPSGAPAVETLPAMMARCAWATFDVASMATNAQADASVARTLTECTKTSSDRGKFFEKEPAAWTPPRGPLAFLPKRTSQIATERPATQYPRCITGTNRILLTGSLFLGVGRILMHTPPGSCNASWRYAEK